MSDELRATWLSFFLSRISAECLTVSSYYHCYFSIPSHVISFFYIYRLMLMACHDRNQSIQMKSNDYSRKYQHNFVENWNCSQKLATRKLK